MTPYGFILRSPITPALVISTTTSTNSFTQFQLSTRVKFISRILLARASVSGNNYVNGDQSSVVVDSLKVLQWDQLCDCVASFAGTSLGAKATKEQLWNLDKSYGDSMRLLEETNAAVEMQKYGAMMDFTGIDVALVGTCIQCARRSFPVSGIEAMALVTLLQFVEALQSNVKAAINEDSDWLSKFMPLAEMVMELMINGSLIKFIEQLVDEDGSVKDSASSSLRQARSQVRFLERKLYQLMESMIRNEMTESSAEVCNVDGRWCIQSQADTRPSFEGLLLSSGSGAGNVVEPLSAVPLNDELQQAKASVAKAEADVLLKITHKMQEDLNDIENIFDIMIQIDVINARARYSLSFGGACPDLYLLQDKDSPRQLDQDKFAEDKSSIRSPPSQKTWTLYLPKANHPLLLLKHRQNLQMAMKDLRNANAEIRRKKQQGGFSKLKDHSSLNLPSLEMQIAKLKQAVPVPFDIFIAQKTRVLLITGPNTGGKTICLKTVGLAAMMAKSGLYVLASEPARIPWFDFVLADIGDEQSLSQSLSTFSGHLKQISEIKSLSTNLSLVLVDEVGAGTNPLEGAALGMSLLESFAHAGALLTIASTHHGELKTLKYSNDAFENACMEFDEVNLKPTYRILWGVPGRSNAINIAERLGLPGDILENARELYGAASTEMNEVIIDMEKFKQDYHDNIHESQHYLRHSKDLHQKLTLTKNRVMKHTTEQKHKMLKEISEAASSARSILHSKVRQSRLAQPTNQIIAEKDTHLSASVKDNESAETRMPLDNNTKQSIPERRLELPKIGDTITVASINKKAVVLKVDPSKDEIVVKSGFLKLKLKLADIVM